MLIENIQRTLSAMKGEIEMNDDEKFLGFTQSMIDENEQKHGAEIRAKYGDETIDASNRLLRTDRRGLRGFSRGRPSRIF